MTALDKLRWLVRQDRKADEHDAWEMMRRATTHLMLDVAIHAMRRARTRIGRWI